MAANSRSVITQDSFSVAPNLLGLPLAGPWRRLAAMLLDCILVALLVRTGGLVLGIAGALLLWRISAPAQGEGLLRRPVRNALRFGAAFIVFLTLSWTWGLFENFGSDSNDEAHPAAEVGHSSSGADIEGVIDRVDLSGTEAITLSTTILRLLNEDDSDDARDQAQKLVGSISEKSSEDRTQIGEALLEIARERNNEVMRDAVASAFGIANNTARPAMGDSLARVFLAALDSGQSARADTLRSKLEEALAGPKIARLERRVEQADARADSLTEVLENAEGPHGLRVLLSSVLDDLGLGFGWSAVYFTAMLALFRGQTPGKRLMKARVIRLDGKPLGWWYSFERFGGYAASVTLGLLGFAQILWDRNRQGIHDKIVETVVIKT